MRRPAPNGFTSRALDSTTVRGLGTTLIGIDCATEARNVGLARGRIDGDEVVLHEARCGSNREDVLAQVVTWIEGPTLVAIDAPLGWPRALAAALMQHRAGEAIATLPNTLFRRRTDAVVKAALGKTPLDVGADRIARTAHEALRFLGELRARTGLPVPLAWDTNVGSLAAIEVYPAATLASRGWAHRGYKGDPEIALPVRRRMIASLGSEVRLLVDAERLAATDHELDAALCVLAAADFHRGRAVSPTPEEQEAADREGWIWFCPK